MNEQCYKEAIETLERADSLIKKAYILDDIDPKMIEPLVSPDMWLWKRESFRIDYEKLTQKDLLEWHDKITREALERFADCECLARQPGATTKLAPRIKITGIRPVGM